MYGSGEAGRRASLGQQAERQQTRPRRAWGGKKGATRREERPVEGAEGGISTGNQGRGAGGGRWNGGRQRMDERSGDDRPASGEGRGRAQSTAWMKLTLGLSFGAASEEKLDQEKVGRVPGWCGCGKRVPLACSWRACCAAAGQNSRAECKRSGRTVRQSSGLID
jgi:hypothetical protein